MLQKEWRIPDENFTHPKQGTALPRYEHEIMLYL